MASAALLVLAALLLSVLGPRLVPHAYVDRTQQSMMHGMMSGGMMSGGMMDNLSASDPNRPFDQAFLDQMIVHHEHGVMMTQHMIADSQRPELRDLAQRITTAQQHEIEQMRQWRRDWYGSERAGTSQEAMAEQMLSTGGMMNSQQMRQMMSGNVDLDRMFLQMMILHHEDAIRMAEQALTQAQHFEVKTLSQTIVTTQRAEIEEMQSYLKAWYGMDA